MKKFALLFLIAITGAYAQTEQVKFAAVIKNRNTDSIFIETDRYQHHQAAPYAFGAVRPTRKVRCWHPCPLTQEHPFDILWCRRQNNKELSYFH